MDATLKSLELFNQPDHWGRIDEDVPVFIPHQTKDSEGEPVKVDEKRLQKIADVINKNFKESGCPIKFYLGHTKSPKEVSQDKQPKILAYGVGARVGRWGPGKKIGLLIEKVYCRKDSVEQYEQLPERSAEFYPPTNEIRGVALLKTDPRLDMGFVIYHGGDGVLRYSRGVQYMAAATADPKADPTTMPPKKDTPDPGEEGTELDGGAIPEEERQKFMKYMAACYPHLHKMKPPEETPGLSAPPMKGTESTATPMGRDALSLHYERLKAEGKQALDSIKAEARKEIDSLKTEKRVISYERDLTYLQSEGYVFDLAEEMNDCKPMTQEQFDKHKAKIVKRYERDITKRQVIDTTWNATNPTGDKNVITEAHQAAALQYQREHTDEDLSWEECVEKTRTARK